MACISGGRGAVAGIAEDRFSVLVGRKEYEKLSEAWEAYLDITRSDAMDPVVAMRKAGDVLRAVGGLMASGTPEHPAAVGD